MTTGETLEETKFNIREAIEGRLQTMREFGDPIPVATSFAGEVEVANAACKPLFSLRELRTELQFRSYRSSVIIIQDGLVRVG